MTGEEFILSYRGTLRTHPALEEATTAALNLKPDSHVDGIRIYKIEEVGYVSRTNMIASQKLAKEKNYDDDGSVA